MNVTTHHSASPFARIAGWVVVCLIVFLLVPAAAWAEDAKRYRDEISQNNQRVTELRDAAPTMTSELDTVDKWLQEALVQVGKEEFKAVQALLRRVEVQLDYVQAQSALAQSTAAANELETKLGEVKQSVFDLGEEKTRLAEKEQKLKSQLDSK